jgi:hypothetical protein
MVGMESEAAAASLLLSLRSAGQFAAAAVATVKADAFMSKAVTIATGSLEIANLDVALNASPSASETAYVIDKTAGAVSSV